MSYDPRENALKSYFFKRAAQAIVLLFAFIGFVSIFSSDPPTENEAPDTKVAQPIVQPQAEPVPVAATPPVKEQAPQPDMETETETSGIIIAPAVNVEELSCPEPVSVKLEYNGDVFSVGADRARSDHGSEIKELHAKIGELTVVNDFLARGLKR